MRDTTETRRAQFRAALALAGLTVDAFCERQQITKSHLYPVLRGERASMRLTAAIDAFIAEHLTAKVA
jgi:predicted transcriptional regulator